MRNGEVSIHQSEQLSHIQSTWVFSHTGAVGNAHHPGLTAVLSVKNLSQENHNLVKVVNHPNKTSSELECCSRTLIMLPATSPSGPPVILTVKKSRPSRPWWRRV